MIFSVVQRFLPQKPPRPVLPAGIMGQLGNTRRSSTVWWGRYQNSLTKFIRGILEVIQFKHALYISTADSALTKLMSHHESILQINLLLLNSFAITQQRSVNQRNVVCGCKNLIFPDCRVLQVAKYFSTRSENCTRTVCYGWKYTVNAFQKCDLIAAWKCGLIIGCEFSAREKSREGSSGKDFTCFRPPNFQNQPPPTAPSKEGHVCLAW